MMPVVAAAAAVASIRGRRPHPVLDQLTLEGDVRRGNLLSPLLFHMLLLLTQKQNIVWFQVFLCGSANKFFCGPWIKVAVKRHVRPRLLTTDSLLWLWLLLAIGRPLSGFTSVSASVPAAASRVSRGGGGDGQ